LSKVQKRSFILQLTFILQNKKKASFSNESEIKHSERKSNEEIQGLCVKSQTLITTNQQSQSSGKSDANLESGNRTVECKIQLSPPDLNYSTFQFVNFSPNLRFLFESLFNCLFPSDLSSMHNLLDDFLKFYL